MDASPAPLLALLDQLRLPPERRLGDADTGLQLLALTRDGVQEGGPLLHFTSAEGARAIAREGFALGCPDLARLGMTRHRRATGPGYGFAFLAKDFPDGWNERWGADVATGGRAGLVVFRAHHVETRQNVDDVPQAIFWGPDVPPFDVEAFESDGMGGWVRGGLSFERLPELVLWAEARAGRRTEDTFADRFRAAALRSLASGRRLGLQNMVGMAQGQETCGEVTGLPAAFERAGLGLRLEWVGAGNHEARWRVLDGDGAETTLAVRFAGVPAGLVAMLNRTERGGMAKATWRFGAEELASPEAAAMLSDRVARETAKALRRLGARLAARVA